MYIAAMAHPRKVPIQLSPPPPPEFSIIPFNCYIKKFRSTILAIVIGFCAPYIAIFLYESICYKEYKPEKC